MKKFQCLVLITAVLLSGCSAIGPTNNSDFPKLAEAPVPLADRPVHLYGPAQWFPNSRGFTAVRSLALGGGQASVIPGVLVISEKALLFEQWDERQNVFEVIKRLPFDELMSVQLDTYGRGRQLVVRKKDMSFESFNYTGASGQMIDQEKTEAAVVFLQKRVHQDGAESRGEINAKE